MGFTTEEVAIFQSAIAYSNNFCQFASKFESLHSATSKPRDKMSGRQGGGRRDKVLIPPINFIFRLLTSHAHVSIWLYEQLGFRIEGYIRGFDEFMNLVIDSAVEVRQATAKEPEARRTLGQILLKGDNVSLIQELQA